MLSFLVTKTTDRFSLVWEGDPAVKAKKGQQSWISVDAATLKSGQKPDVMICRPLSGDEVLRIVTAVEHEPSLIVQAAALGVVSIEMGTGERIDDPQGVRDVLLHAANLESVTELAQSVFVASREGVDALPFRHESPQVERHDNGDALRSDVRGVPAIA